MAEAIRAHAWGNAEAADLWKSLGAASGKDILGVMGGYVEQRGLPLVSVEPQADGSVKLSQKRQTQAAIAIASIGPFRRIAAIPVHHGF